ncbi:MAG: hypothetical protein JXA81_09255 [Sedimentisphaerales bacterium]|nr:hypothetical protein [Sedimentisphaerales bacterium]
MKKIRITVTVLCLAILMSNRTLKADDGVSIGASADIFSKYVWRGQNLVDDWVLQPGAYINYKNITASFWGNLDLTNENGHNGEFSEIDLTLDYTGQVPGADFLSYSIGVINYDFPINGGAEDTWEIYWGFGLDVPASPSVTVYHDVDEVDGTYVSFSIGHSIEKLAESGLSVDLSASIGWGSAGYNKYYWGPDKSELNDLVLSAAFPFEAAGLAVIPSVNYITLMGDDIRSSNTYGQNDMWIFGVGFAKDF